MTTRGSTLINRSPNGFSESSYGLLQGDPLSPYLLILLEEILSLNLHSLQSRGLIHPICPVAFTPCHLFYTDECDTGCGAIGI